MRYSDLQGHIIKIKFMYVEIIQRLSIFTISSKVLN